MPPGPVQLYAGSLHDFDGSMAAEIERALNAVRGEAGLEPLPTGDRDRRMLFIAIARGVINHLKKQEEAFLVHVDGTHPANGHPTIDVRSP